MEVSDDRNRGQKGQGQESGRLGSILAGNQAISIANGNFRIHQQKPGKFLKYYL